MPNKKAGLVQFFIIPHHFENSVQIWFQENSTDWDSWNWKLKSASEFLNERKKRWKPCMNLLTKHQLSSPSAVTLPWIYPLAMQSELDRSCQAAAHEVTLSLRPARESRRGCLLPENTTLFHVMFLAFCTHTWPLQQIVCLKAKEPHVVLAQQTAVGISSTESLCWPCLGQTDECEITALKLISQECLNITLMTKVI